MPGECASHLLYILSNPIVTQVLSPSSSYPTCAHLLLLAPPMSIQASSVGSVPGIAGTGGSSGCTCGASSHNFINNSQLVVQCTSCPHDAYRFST